MNVPHQNQHLDLDQDKYQSSRQQPNHCLDTRTPSPGKSPARYRHSLKYSGGALHDGPREPLEFDHTFDMKNNKVESTASSCHSDIQPGLVILHLFKAQCLPFYVVKNEFFKLHFAKQRKIFVYQLTTTMEKRVCFCFVKSTVEKFT